jgi:hypothetical protein
VVATLDTTIMFAYSARKNSAKRMPLYSVWNPPVSSCSASAMSNRAVGFREAADEKQDERDRLHENEPEAGELRSDLHHAQTAGGHDQADQRHRHGHFVADELRRRAQAGSNRNLLFDAQPPLRMMP